MVLSDQERTRSCAQLDGRQVARNLSSFFHEMARLRPLFSLKLTPGNNGGGHSRSATGNTTSVVSKVETKATWSENGHPPTDALYLGVKRTREPSEGEETTKKAAFLNERRRRACKGEGNVNPLLRLEPRHGTSTHVSNYVLSGFPIPSAESEVLQYRLVYG